jgi:hypothetical protein
MSRKLVLSITRLPHRRKQLPRLGPLVFEEVGEGYRPLPPTNLGCNQRFLESCNMNT